MKKILFVCTGNTCRSPMAEFIMKKKLNIYGRERYFEIKSAGISVSPYGNNISDEACTVLKNVYDISVYHTAEQLTKDMLEDADLVLCMEQRHADIIKHIFDDNITRNVFSLNAYVGIYGDIADPYGGEVKTYESTAREIENAIELLIKKEGGNHLIAIGSDHGGYELKEALKAHYGDLLEDFGAYNNVRGLDEPKVAIAVGEAVASNRCECGILICRSGVGMCMAANKVKNIRCGTCYNLEIAKSLKEHNNANIIAIGADYTDVETAIEMIDLWLNSKFLDGIYEERLNIVRLYEEGERYDY